MAHHTISRIEPLPAAKVATVIYGIMGCIYIPFAWIGVFAGGEGFGMLFILFMPLLYAIMGFIVTLIGAMLYNVAGGWVGGIRVVLED